MNISAGFTTGDMLAADVGGTSITAHYDATVGRLTFTGSDTLAHYQQVLRTVTYSSTSNNPTDSGLHPSRTIDWQVNDGGSTAFQGTSYAVGSTPDSVAVADLNGDGKLDLIIANAGSNTVSVLLGNGAGGFGPATSFNVGTGPASVTVGDLNGDGKLDLVVASTGSTPSRCCSATAPAALALAAILPQGRLPTRSRSAISMATAIPTWWWGPVSPTRFLAGYFGAARHRQRSFGAATNTYAGSSPRAATIADVNGDGKLDVIVGSTLAGSIVILLGGNGAGGFSSTRSIGVGEKGGRLGGRRSQQ